MPLPTVNVDGVLVYITPSRLNDFP